MKIGGFLLASCLMACILLPRLDGAESIGEVALKSCHGNDIGRRSAQHSENKNLAAHEGSITKTTPFGLYLVSGHLGDMSSAAQNRITTLEKEVKALREELKELRRQMFLIPPEDEECIRVGEKGTADEVLANFLANCVYSSLIQRSSCDGYC